jgi:long-chain acyl-CoA synthetase
MGDAVNAWVQSEYPGQQERLPQHIEWKKEDSMDTINNLFATSVEKFGGLIALMEPTNDSGMSTLTFSELQQRVQCFAGYLQDRALQKGERVLLWSESRIDWMVAYLSVLQVGGVVVPLDVHSREDFIGRIVQTTQAKYLITPQQLSATLQSPQVPVIDLDALPGGVFNAMKVPAIGEDDLAAIVFTSGTTGQPKGVMLSHRNIASNATASLKIVEVTPNDRLLSILPLSHMFELTLELAILKSGASILYARSLVPDTLLKLLGSQHITFMILVPQALQLFMNGIERQVRLQKKVKQWELLNRIAAWLPFRLRPLLFRPVHKSLGGHFRFFISGGAYLPPKLAQGWENMGIRVLQGYGTTECSPVVSGTTYKNRLLETVGKPLPGVEVRLAEDDEIVVRGSNVALGYWKNPEATTAAFRDGWYYTGDLGYMDDKGNLYLKGRKNNLIVLANGMKVYPEDVENIMLTIPSIKDAVVVGLKEGDNGPVVHGILLIDDPDHARTAVQQTNRQLASHQQVRTYTIWPEEDFPRTLTLKVKRPEVLEKLQAIRRQIKEKVET